MAAQHPCEPRGASRVMLGESHHFRELLRPVIRTRGLSIRHPFYLPQLICFGIEHARDPISRCNCGREEWVLGGTAPGTLSVIAHSRFRTCQLWTHNLDVMDAGRLEGMLPDETLVGDNMSRQGSAECQSHVAPG